MARALLGSMRRRVRLRQFVRSLKPCPTGARAADRAWLAWRWAGVVLRVRVALSPVMMTGSSGSGSRPVKPRPAGEGAEPGSAQPACDVVVAAGGDLAGGAPAG
jgi:hypothetical protein